MMNVDFEVWAPLGADEPMTELWYATPDATGLPAGIEPLPPAIAAREKLGELSVPTLVVTVSHDPVGHQEAGLLLAREAPNARHVELDSDHYVTLRDRKRRSRPRVRRTRVRPWSVTRGAELTAPGRPVVRRAPRMYSRRRPPDRR